MKKLSPPLVALFIGLWVGGCSNPINSVESIPSKILTTWKSEDERLTLYETSTGQGVDGFFFNSKSGEIDRIVKGRYRGNTLSGYYVRAKSNEKCDYTRFGSFYWGSFMLEFGEDSFKGKLGDCNNQGIEEWNGALD